MACLNTYSVDESRSPNVIDCFDCLGMFAIAKGFMEMPMAE